MYKAIVHTIVLDSITSDSVISLIISNSSVNKMRNTYLKADNTEHATAYIYIYNFFIYILSNIFGYLYCQTINRY